MTISDNRFGAEIITQKGKIYKFDDAGCAASFLEAGKLSRKDVGEIYFTDFSGDHSLILSGQAYFLKSPDLKGPMGGEFTAFSNQDSLNTVLKRFGGNMVAAGTILKP
jgi:copper chaperone NosL